MIAIARMGISARVSSRADPRVPSGHLTVMMGTLRPARALANWSRVPEGPGPGSTGASPTQGTGWRVDEVTRYATAVMAVGLVGLGALFSNRLAERIRVPAPALMFVAAAVVVQLDLVPEPPERTVERLVTVALLFILFDGGLHIGWRRFRSAAGPIAVAGVLGTFLTVGVAALLLHVGFGLVWFGALLVATAVAPTDPAMVFSVLGKRGIEGRSSAILEGESGANDPVGIALLSGLVAVGAVNGAALGQVGLIFVVQMVVGAAIGIVGGKLVVVLIRRFALPSEALYPIRTVACVLVLYGVTTLAHGSGFLAVFVAGIVIGDVRAPYKREIERFHSAIAGIGEIVAFVVLGLTVRLSMLLDPAVWVTGLVLALALTFVIRPLLIGACLVRSGLGRNEKTFVVLAGLKGAVPILLAEMLRGTDVPYAEQLYGIIVVVVMFSVLVQATFTPTVARLLKLPMRIVETEPWVLGVRLRDEPQGVARFTVAEGASAVGRSISSLGQLGENFWINVLVRDRQAVSITGDTALEAGDELLVQTDGASRDSLDGFFARPE